MTILNIAVNPTDATNKQYVDLIASSFSFLDATLCATTANLTANYSNGASGIGSTLTNAGTLQAFSVDNYNPVATNRVLIKDQTTTYENGVYEITTLGDSATAWVLTRTLDYDQPSEIIPGSLVSVLYGDTNGDTIWAETQQVNNIGTDPIQFVQFNSGSQGALLAVNNLSDVQDVATSRANLGLTNVATQNVTQYSVLVGDANDGIVSLPTGANGQVLTSGGANVNPSWQTIQGTGFSAINVQIFDTPGTYTYTPTANMQYCIVEVQGAGGGGGTGVYTGGSNQTYSTGGASGAYCKSLFNAATIGVSQSLTVGAGGNGGSNANGQNGQSSSFGSLMTAQGGTGGLTTSLITTGALATGGNISNSYGNLPTVRFQIINTLQNNAISDYFGVGASSLYGAGGFGFGTITTKQYGGSSNGQNALSYGAGGGGGAWYTNTSGYPTPPNAVSGNGGNGIIIITEYIGG